MRIVLAAAAAATMTSAGLAGTGPTVWSGYDYSFSKSAFGSEQDQITDNVAITRGNVAGIFNAVSETSYSSNFSPAGTVWAFGHAADWASLTFDDWQTTVGSNPPSSVGQDMVMWLQTDGIVLDVRFTEWGPGPSNGGSFSYVRATPTPGGAAVLGLAGLGVMRRRRR
ncbi:MAG: hypothetical protein KDA21_01565 [Phycisphaerales bacterium]|nr:hypothetical protein [Phycisphaerales bacterium]